MSREVDVAIIGAGTAGLSALSQVRRATSSFVLINGGPLGTTCARVGCMPSKAAIQVAHDFHRRDLFERHGIDGADSLSLDQTEAMEHVRDLRDNFVDRVLSNSTDHLGAEHLIDGYAELISPNELRVNNQTIRARAIIIAAGTQPIVPPEWAAFSDRILTTDTFFEQETLPPRIAVFGLGIVGLELGQTLARMGVEVTGLELGERIAGITDPAANTAAIEAIGRDFPIWVNARGTIAPHGDALRVHAGEREVEVDAVLAALGRRADLNRLRIDRLGLPLDHTGLPAYDPHTMQIGDLPVFIAGDIVGHRPILHEAGDEGRIAGYNATQAKPVAFRRRTPLAIVFSDPNIAMVGTPFNELDPATTVIGEMPMAPVGRALIMGANRGLIRVYADKRDGRVLGATLVAPQGENLAHLLAWSIQRNSTVVDLLRMPYYHPVIEEALQAALRNALGQLECEIPTMPEFETLA
ncbi:MAG: dihydrolipoyl dehydrogenase [Chromatiales bacterium]|nr:dihydrolipoyl dehydrogenase [Chromatiales bacterium]